MCSSSVCFLCAKTFSFYPSNDNNYQLKLNAISTQSLALFSERFLKLPPESRFISILCSNERSETQQSSSRTSSSSSIIDKFCSDCLGILQATLQLYNELCEVRLKMAWRLGQWEGLLKEDETSKPSRKLSSLLLQNVAEQLEIHPGIGNDGTEEVREMKNLLLAHCKKARNQMLDQRRLEVALDRCSVPLSVARQGKSSDFNQCGTTITDDEKHIGVVAKRELDDPKFECADVEDFSAMDFEADDFPSTNLTISDDEDKDEQDNGDFALENANDDDAPEEKANEVKKMDIDDNDVKMKTKRKLGNAKRRHVKSDWKLTRGRGFKKALISKLLSSNGITKDNFGGNSESNPELSTKINDAMQTPLKTFPMNYDPSTDTISVGDVTVLVNEKEGSLKCSECSLKFYHGTKRKHRGRAVPSGTVAFQMHDHILRRHLVESKGFKFECPICSSSQITTFRGYEDHLKMHFALHPCDICGRPFGAKKDMRRHKLTHLSRSERSETVASAQGTGGMQTFIFGAIMKASKLEKYPEEVRSIISDVAGDQTMSEWKRKLLLRVIRNTSNKAHTQENSPHAKFPLVYHHETGKLAVSNLSKDIEVEIFFVQGHESLECSVCSERFDGRFTAEYHMQNHILGVHLDGFKCPFCENKIFDNYPSYHAHVVQVHSYDSSAPAICEICGKTLKNSDTLKQHKTKVHKNVDEVPKVKPKSKVRTFSHISRKKVQCSTCGHTFALPSHLRRHEKTHLTPDQMEYHVCNLCGRRYSSVYLLNRHLKLSCSKNPKIQRLPCKHCGKTLKNSEQLRKHVLTLHPEKADEQFGERPFQCEKCSGRFATQWNLDIHFAARHAKKGAGATFPCRKKCGKVLASEHGRKVHETHCDGAGCKTDRK